MSPALSPGDPPRALVPFAAEKAGEHQEAWAKHLGVKPEINNVLDMKLRLIPPGEFQMGSSREQLTRLKKELAESLFDEKERQDWEARVECETPIHPVRLTKPFYLGVHEVTVAQFRRFVEEAKYVTDAERDGKGGGVPAPETGVPIRDAKTSWRKPFAFAIEDDQPVLQVSWNDAQEFCRTWKATPGNGALIALPPATPAPRKPTRRGARMSPIAPFAAAPFPC